MVDKLVTVRPLAKNDFDALVVKTRAPASIMLVKELAWYTTSTGEVIGTILQDNIDKDFSYVTMMRDGAGLFRAQDTVVSIPMYKEAREQLVKAMLRRAAELSKPMGAVMDVDWVTFTCPCGAEIRGDAPSFKEWLEEHQNHTNGQVAETVTVRGQKYLADSAGVRMYPLQKLLGKKS